MIQLKITMTGKSIGSKERYSIFNQESKTFDTLEKAKQFLKDLYGKHKRVKMYQDPDAKHIGYIYCFNNADYSHVPIQSWHQQDWVEFQEVKITSPIINGGL